MAKRSPVKSRYIVLKYYDTVFHIPSEFRFIAADPDGAVFAYKTRPIETDHGFDNWPAYSLGDIGILPNWRESLYDLKSLPKVN